MKKQNGTTYSQINALLHQAVNRFRQGQSAEAGSLLRGILAIDPNHPYACQLAGVIAGKRSEYALAEKLIARAIKRNPREPVFLIIMVTHCFWQAAWIRLEPPISEPSG